MAQEYGQLAQDEWVSFPGGELEGRRPKVLCAGCRAALQREAAGSPTRPDLVRPDGDAKPRRWSRVSRIDLYDGDPKDIAQLKPDDEDAKEDSWSFNAPSPPERPLYMACVFFDTRPPTLSS